MKIDTIAVHGGYKPDPVTKAVAVPIYQTTSYAFDSTQHAADLFDLKVQGNIYTRIKNPTTDVLEKRVAELEGGIAALGLASGMAAISYANMTIAEAGDNIVTSSALYGGTYNLFAHTFPQYGIEVRFADYREPRAWEKLIDARSKQVLSIERLRPLHERAREHLAPLRMTNLRLVYGDGMRGHPPNAPYESIIAAAGGEALPPAWLEQLAVGGRLVAPLQEPRTHRQVLVVVDRHEGGYEHSVHEAVKFVPLKSGLGG